MKQFDYNKYLKNNPLLKESINEATIRDLIKPLTSKLESMGYEVDVDPTFGFPMIKARKTLPDGSVLQMYVQPSEDEIQKKIGQPVVGETIDVEFNHWTREVVKRFFGLLKTKGDWDLKRLPDEAGRNIDLGTGMFDIPVEQSVTKVIDLLKKAEQKVSGGTPTRQMTRDADADFMGEGVYEDRPFTSKLYQQCTALGISWEENSRDPYPIHVEDKRGHELWLRINEKSRTIDAVAQGLSKDIPLYDIGKSGADIANMLKSMNSSWFRDNDPEQDMLQEKNNESIDYNKYLKNNPLLKEFTDDPQAEEDAEAFVSTPEGNKAVAELKSFISRPYEDEELQDLLNMLKLTREQFLTVAQVAGMKLKSGWGGITIKDRNYKGTTPYIEYVPDTRKWWVG